MDMNNGKPLSPWKAPSRISLKRIRHKINSDLPLQLTPSPLFENKSQKQFGKRNRTCKNQFIIAPSISTPAADENVTLIVSEKTNNDEYLLTHPHQIMAPTLPTSSQYNVALKTLSFHETFNNPERNKSSDEIVSSFPTDWSLKSSCCLSSPTSSAFLNNFMKLRSIDESLSLEYICSHTSQDNEKALFRSLTSYWIYPHITWLRLFPRTQQQQPSNINFSSLDEQAQLALQDEWKITFQSLFQAFRTKYCAFFYMCTHSFNILFREDPTSQIVAIISPTTSGLRSTLEREGIEFTLADGGDLLNNSSNKSKDDEDEENTDENDITCAQLLECMGKSTTAPTHAKNPNNERRGLSSNKKSSNERTRPTTIIIRDLSSVNSLFNFLLNKSQRTCMCLTGSLTGIPPTLISPRPFLNGTLRYLNVHFQSNSMVTIDGGPLLPDRMKGLWNLIAEKHQQIQMTCTNVERTSALNLNGDHGRTIKQMSINSQQDICVKFATV